LSVSDFGSTIAGEDLALEILGRTPKDPARLIDDFEPSLIIGGDRVEPIFSKIEIDDEAESRPTRGRRWRATIERACRVLPVDYYWVDFLALLINSEEFFK
jgi:hypothetical protein